MDNLAIVLPDKNFFDIVQKNQPCLTIKRSCDSKSSIQKLKKFEFEKVTDIPRARGCDH